MIAVLRDILMIDELPKPTLAVYIFLEFIALGFALESVAAFVRGDPWSKWLGALLLGIIFMILGVKSGKIIESVSHILPSRESFNRSISIASRAVVVLAWLLVAVAAYYTWTRVVHVRNVIVEVGNSSTTQDNATGTKQNAQPSANILHANDTSPGQHKKAVPLASQPLPIQRVDWHDKQNWRKYLHTGMSRSEVRELFGDPRNMSVEGDMEFWRYEDFDAEIVFQMDSHKDGSLFSWEEPK